MSDAIKRTILLASCNLFLILAASSVNAQQAVMRCDPPNGSLSHLSKSQLDAFQRSQDMFIARHFSDSLAALKVLLAEVPSSDQRAQTAIAERTAEAAIEAGEQTYAIALLRPIEKRDDHDCLAHMLLARANAEEGDRDERNQELNALIALHAKSPESPAGKLDVFLLEQHGLKRGGLVQIWYALHPIGIHRTQLNAEVFDAAGAVALSAELDSDEGDQVYFNQLHPELVARGERRYSLDVFGAPKKLPNGGVDVHHFPVLALYDGRPDYDKIRDVMIAIAEHGLPATP